MSIHEIERVCGRCEGTGEDPRYPVTLLLCPDCAGRGRVGVRVETRRVQTDFGIRWHWRPVGERRFKLVDFTTEADALYGASLDAVAAPEAKRGS